MRPVTLVLLWPLIAFSRVPLTTFKPKILKDWGSWGGEVHLSKCEFKKYIYIYLALSVVPIKSFYTALVRLLVYVAFLAYLRSTPTKLPVWDDRAELLAVAGGSERPHIVQHPHSGQRYRGEIVLHNRDVSPLRRQQLHLRSLPAGQWHSIVFHTL